MTRLNRGVSTFLAFSLLLFQVVLPWTARYYLTMDGPSHLYNARALAGVLFDPASPYARFYQLRRAISANWGTTLLFNVASWFSAERAEAMVATFSVVLTFFCFHYLIRSLNREACWSPLVNVLISCWFLWAGFYNFYLATALFALAVGYFLKHENFTWKHSLYLGLLLVATFLTHVLPAALAMLTLVLLGFPNRRLIAALTPVSLLVLVFLTQSRGTMKVQWELFPEWAQIPSLVFSTTYLPPALATYLMPVVLLFALASVLQQRRLALALSVCIALALFLPSKGFGGEEINLRIAWVVFVVGAAILCATPRMQQFGGLAAGITAAFLVPFLFRAMQMNVQSVSNAAAVYRDLTREIPRNATVVTVHYGSGFVAREYGYKGISLDPLYHADSWIAAQRGFVVLSDYQPLSRVFALECRPPITDLQRADLWALEAASPVADAALQRVLSTPPSPIDHVLVFGNTGLEPGPGMTLTAAASTRGFLRVYRSSAH